MKTLFTRIGRSEIVVALTALTVGSQAALDATTTGLGWSTVLRTAATAAVGVIIRANVYSKASVEG